MKKWSEFLEGRCWPGYKPKPGKKAYSPGSCVKEDLRQWFDPDHPKGGWKRINSKGEAIGPCAREPGEAKPKCMSNEKRAKLDKKERASAVASKRKHDPNPERKGEPINVSNFGKGKISENMENLEEKNVPTSPEKWAQAKSQAKAKFDVYPSAYANGWAAKKYKEMGGGWKSVSEESEVVQEGRPSQRHPLEGHEYHKKSDEALIHIAKDAHKAAEAMKSHNTTAENKYRDQANDSATVRHFRKTSGMPEWYKKKYGHIKEAKEKTEYDYEGDMARGQLQSIVNNAQRVHDMLKDNDNLPEWVQSKITLAEDYISTVANYMMSEVDEEVESLDELSKDTLKSYMDKSSKDNLTSLMKPGMIAKKHAAKRFIGMMKAGEKLTKEANSANMPADIGTPAQLSLKPNPKKLETPVYEAFKPMDQPDYSQSIKDRQKKADDNKVPFEGPYSKAKDTITDKSGAKHGPMSRARSLARQAIQKQKVTQKKTVAESRRLEIVREAMVDAKKKDAVKKVEKKVTNGGNDKFQADPELSSNITKSA